MNELDKTNNSDAISRQAVRDTIFVECSGEKLDIDFAKILLLQRAIKALPPGNPPQALNEFADNLERIEKKYAEPQGRSEKK